VQSEARPNRDSHHLGTTVETAAMHRVYEGIVQSVIEEGRGSGHFRDDIDVRVATLGVLGACNWLTNWYRRGGRLTIDEISESLLGMLLAGLRAPADGAAAAARSAEVPHSAR
jgi:hypothetical protein